MASIEVPKRKRCPSRLAIVQKLFCHLVTGGQAGRVFDGQRILPLGFGEFRLQMDAAFHRTGKTKHNVVRRWLFPDTEKWIGRRCGQRGQVIATFGRSHSRSHKNAEQTETLAHRFVVQIKHGPFARIDQVRIRNIELGVRKQDQTVTQQWMRYDAFRFLDREPVIFPGIEIRCFEDGRIPQIKSDPPLQLLRFACKRHRRRCRKIIDLRNGRDAEDKKR